jgi:hypothetical protein
VRSPHCTTRWNGRPCSPFVLSKDPAPLAQFRPIAAAAARPPGALARNHETSHSPLTEWPARRLGRAPPLPQCDLWPRSLRDHGFVTPVQCLRAERRGAGGRKNTGDSNSGVFTLSSCIATVAWNARTRGARAGAKAGRPALTAARRVPKVGANPPLTNEKAAIRDVDAEMRHARVRGRGAALSIPNRAIL